MSLALSPKEREAAVASLQRYACEHMDQPLGNLAADALLDFFLEEWAPIVYNRGVSDAQRSAHARIAELDARIDELDVELYAEPFTYWRR